MLRDGEAEARAGDFLRAAFVDAIEAPKNLRALRFRDSIAVIGDADHAGIRFVDHFDLDLAVIGAVLDRIVEQIRKSLLQAQDVAADVGIALDGEPHSMMRGLIGEVFAQIIEHPA